MNLPFIPGYDPDAPGGIESLNSIQRLTRDLKNATITLSTTEARFLVDAYYAMQRDRIRAAHQERTLSQGDEPHDVMSWLAEQRETLENQVRRALDAYSLGRVPGVWARSVVGIGPVISAGLIANIDITRAPTVGHVWRFAGLDPTMKWEKGQKRPWNGSLKRLCFLIGESFVKVSNNERAIYGHIYKARKVYETTKNERGDYADQAKASLAAKKFGTDTEARKAYEKGKLPLARIHLRSERYAVKFFLAHLHHVMHEAHFGVAPQKPYILTEAAHLAHPEMAVHTHYVVPPNWPMGSAAPSESTVVREQPAATSESTVNDEQPSAVARESTVLREQPITVSAPKRRRSRKQ